MEEYERNGLTVKIETDDDPINPRTEWDNFGTMVCSHRNYELGDEQITPDYYSGWDEVAEALREKRGAAIVLPLGLYDHSGITMYVGDVHDKWDGGQVGFIYATREQIDNEFDGDMDKAEKLLRSEVEDYDHYLTGDIYIYTVTNHKDGEEIECCGGFLGIDAAREEANEIADAYKHPHDAAYAKKASQLHG